MTIQAAIDWLIEADRSSSKTIMVIGDGMSDVYVHGILANTCQEGCSKFVEDGSRVWVPGGAANAARSLSNWSSEVLFYGCMGQIMKTRFMAGDGTCVFRHDDERINLNSAVLDNLRQNALHTLTTNPIGAVLLSDYDKGTLTPEFIKQVSTICQERNIPCVADVKRPPSTYTGCIMKSNGDWYYKYRSADVVTWGSYNPVVGNEIVGHRLPRVRCLNHVGAGDCFAAHLTLCLAYGLSLRESALIAHSASRVYVQHAHNRPPELAEIAADVKSGDRC